MNCLKCKGKTTKIMHHGVELDQCTSCSGIWFDLGELQEVLSDPDIDALKNFVDNNSDHDAIKAHCPRCGGDGNMVPVLKLGKDIHIDTCVCCYGHWLDGGELEKLHEVSIFQAIKNLFKDKDV